MCLASSLIGRQAADNIQPRPDSGLLYTDGGKHRNCGRLPLRLNSMFGSALVWRLCLRELCPRFGGADGSAATSTSRSSGASKLGIGPLLMSKKSLFRKTEKSSSEAGTGSSRDAWAGDSWFRFAMYWDTLGPRWPLYPDMSDGLVTRLPVRDDLTMIVVLWRGRSPSRGIWGRGDRRVEDEWVLSRRTCGTEQSDSMGVAASVCL